MCILSYLQFGQVLRGDTLSSNFDIASSGSQCDAGKMSDFAMVYFDILILIYPSIEALQCFT